MPVLEKHIEQKFVQTLKKVCHLKSLKLNVMFSRGWPDRLILIPGGRPLFIEFKRPGEELTDLQREIHEFLKSLGYEVEVHTSAETAIESVQFSMASSELSKIGCSMADNAPRCRSVLGPELGKDSHFSRSVSSPKKGRKGQQSPCDSSKKSCSKGVE